MHRHVVFGDPPSRTGTSQPCGDQRVETEGEAPVGRSGDGNDSGDLGGDGCVGEDGDGTHGCADENNLTLSVPSPGHSGGDVVVFEVPKGGHARGLTVASGVVSEDVKIVGLEALGQRDNVGMVLGRGEAVGDNDDGAGRTESRPVAGSERDTVDGDNASWLRAAALIIVVGEHQGSLGRRWLAPGRVGGGAGPLAAFLERVVPTALGVPDYPDMLLWGS
jgi:hypothetical protein